MDILASIRKMLVPIHREGYVFILAGLAAMLVLGWVWQPLFWLCGLDHLLDHLFLSRPAARHAARRGLDRVAG